MYGNMQAGGSSGQQIKSEKLSCWMWQSGSDPTSIRIYEPHAMIHPQHSLSGLPGQHIHYVHIHIPAFTSFI